MIFFQVLSESRKMKVYKTLFLNVVLFECKIWSVMLSMDKFRVIGQVSEPEKVEVPGVQRKLHNDELHNLFFFTKPDKW
jgi:hypothetical protein